MVAKLAGTWVVLAAAAWPASANKTISPARQPRIIVMMPKISSPVERSLWAGAGAGDSMGVVKGVDSFAFINLN